MSSVDFSAYKTRLHDIITAIKAMSDLDLTLVWKQDLDQYTAEFLAEQISNMTLSKSCSTATNHHHGGHPEVARY